MQIDPQQLDWIVDEVVRRLRASGDTSETKPGDGGAATSAPNAEACRELALCDRVVTTRTLEGRLSGVGVVRVEARAIVTPAVRDLLNEHGVALVRGAATQVARPPRVAGRNPSDLTNCDQCCRY